MKPGSGHRQAEAGDSARTSRVREFFDDETGYLSAPIVREVRRLALGALRLDVAGKRILDVGCGDASVSLPYASEAAELTLLDFSPVMLAAAARNAAAAPPGKVRIVEGDLMSSDLGGDYDLVLCLGVLAHLSSRESAMARLASLVREGGQLVIQINDCDAPLGLLSWWLGRWRAESRSGYAVQKLSGRAVASVGARHGLVKRASFGFSLLVPGMGRLPHRVVRAVEIATVEHRALGALGTDRMLVFHKPTGAP
jgi:2-polyprenyl-3-methyl-5-hydroxy-6-metoxy-1,4-benzoquinol methylase